ncbi:hypothetical protein OAC12_05380 [Porticoccaceae bacterium]|nr:hypothetical protein [Porticoccaceae bacterium]MDB9805552.1 hypothetical protein [Porticoccaceae bacterium]
MLLSACSTPREDLNTQQRPADFPATLYANPDPQSNLYQLDSASSIVRIKVLRGGAMAKFGHDHIVASRDLQGYLLLSDDGSCRGDFYAALSQLIVDDPALRDQANLITTPTEKDITATKTNMLISLQAAEFPFVQLQSLDCAGASDGQPVPVRIGLHGATQEQQLTMTVTQSDTDAIMISGSFGILQTDFGIEPFSVFNGLLKVQDRLEISYQLVARRQ